jgi:hypothetical protein
MAKTAKKKYVQRPRRPKSLPKGMRESGTMSAYINRATFVKIMNVVKKRWPDEAHWMSVSAKAYKSVGMDSDHQWCNKEDITYELIATRGGGDCSGCAWKCIRRAKTMAGLLRAVKTGDVHSVDGKDYDVDW